jgi:hypothetical protein
LNKTFFSLKEDQHILFVYASPINSCYTKARPLNVLEKIETKTHDFRNTLFLGDLNGRTKTGEDFIRDNLDKHSPINTPSYMKDTEIKRNNQDSHVIDQQGKLILDLCKSSSLKILNGRTFGDWRGQYTRYPRKPNENPSVIDYALCGSSLINKIFSFSVLPFTELSDHCCLSVTIKVNREHLTDSTEAEVEAATVNPIEQFYTYNENRKNIFKENIRKDKNLEILNNILDKTELSQEEVVSSVTCLNNVLLSAAKKSFCPKKILRKTKGRTAKKHKNKKWFNKECSKYRQVLRKYSRNLSSRPFDRNILHLFQRARIQYKRVCRKAERQYRQHLTEQLTNIGMNDPKRFWNIINKMNNWGKEKTEPADHIKPSTWGNYFKSLLNNNITSLTETRQPNATGDMTETDSPLWRQKTFDPILDSRVTGDEMREALKNLKKQKAPGPDGVY